MRIVEKTIIIIGVLIPFLYGVRIVVLNKIFHANNDIEFVFLLGFPGYLVMSVFLIRGVVLENDLDRGELFRKISLLPLSSAALNFVIFSGIFIIVSVTDKTKELNFFLPFITSLGIIVFGYAYAICFGLPSMLVANFIIWVRELSHNKASNKDAQ